MDYDLLTNSAAWLEGSFEQPYTTRRVQSVYEKISRKKLKNFATCGRPAVQTSHVLISLAVIAAPHLISPSLACYHDNHENVLDVLQRLPLRQSEMSRARCTSKIAHSH